MSDQPDKETPTPRTVKRYDPFEKCAMGGTTTGQMREDEHGDWVSFDDYAASTQRVKELEAELAELHADNKHSAEIMDRMGVSPSSENCLEKLMLRIEGRFQMLRSEVAALKADRNAELRAAWEAGFALCRRYGDNHAHFGGQQKERQWALEKSKLDAARSATPTPTVTPDLPLAKGERKDYGNTHVHPTFRDILKNIEPPHGPSSPSTD